MRLLQVLVNQSCGRVPASRARSLASIVASGALLGLALQVLPSAASASPHGRHGLIVFTRGSYPLGRIWTTWSDGSHQRRLKNGKESSFPSFSRDGKRIVFQSDRNSQARNPVEQIFVMNADGSHERQLTRGAQDTSPSFSPDGRHILFARSGAIFVMNADGSGQRELYGDNGDDDSPAYSSDGRLITFISDDTTIQDTSGNRAHEVFVINSDGSGRRQLTTDSDGFDTSPSFSPSGTQIVFTRDVKGGSGSSVSQIFVMNADGSNQRQLTHSPQLVENGDPAFSPNGKLIAFDRLAQSIQIFVMRVDGSHVKQLSHGRSGSADPSWRH